MILFALARGSVCAGLRMFTRVSCVFEHLEDGKKISEVFSFTNWFHLGMEACLCASVIFLS